MEKNIFSDVTWHLVSQVSATAITVTPGSLVSCVSEKITHKTRTYSKNLGCVWLG